MLSWLMHVLGSKRDRISYIHTWDESNGIFWVTDAHLYAQVILKDKNVQYAQ